VCACLTTVSWTAHPSAHPLTCPERHAHEYTSNALTSLQQARPHCGTQPQHNAGLHAQPLAKPTHSHARHHAATTTTTTTTKLQRHHPRAPPVPSRNNVDATSTWLRATRQKHPSNTCQRCQSSKAPQRTPCVQADVRRQNRQTPDAATRRRVVAVPVVVPRAPTRRAPTQAAKAAISKINHHNKRRNEATTHTSSRKRSTIQRSSSVLSSSSAV
jgi:hypothetical protein